MSDWQRMFPDRKATNEFEPGVVDGLRKRFLPSATIDDVVRLSNLGLSPVAIAAHLKVDVLSVEESLRRIAFLEMVKGLRQR